MGESLGRQTDESQTLGALTLAKQNVFISTVFFLSTAD